MVIDSDSHHLVTTSPHATYIWCSTGWYVWGKLWEDLIWIHLEKGLWGEFLRFFEDWVNRKYSSEQDTSNNFAVRGHFECFIICCVFLKFQLWKDIADRSHRLKLWSHYIAIVHAHCRLITLLRDIMGIAPQTRVTCATDWSLHGNTIQIQYKYNTNTIEIQHNSNTNTMQIREEYLMGAEPIVFFTLNCQLWPSSDVSDKWPAAKTDQIVTWHHGSSYLSWEFLPHGSIVQCFSTKLQKKL